jgi:uncharacterized protein (DUF4415 family)
MRSSRNLRPNLAFGADAYSSNRPLLDEVTAITAVARNDPDAQPLTSKQLKSMVPMRALRGRPKSENKKLLLSVRYSPEVVAYFKSTGEGWQSRMDAVLREYVARNFRRG